MRRTYVHVEERDTQRAVARNGSMGRSDAFDRTMAWLRSVTSGPVSNPLAPHVSATSGNPSPTSNKETARVFCSSVPSSVSSGSMYERFEITPSLDPPSPVRQAQRKSEDAFRLNNPNLSHIW